VSVARERGINRRPLAREALLVDPGTVTGPTRAATAVVLPMPISPRQTRSASGETASRPAATAARNAASSIAGATVMSAVGRSSDSALTRRSAAATRASWLMAAPPAAKFATICAVTSAG
jgi:hypothetical protein